MAEVGVLDLVVHAGDIQKQAQALEDLGVALNLIKVAVKGGINLSPVSKQIEQFTTKVNAYIGKSVLGKIEQLGEALETIKVPNELTNLTINIKEGNGLAKVEKVMESVRDDAAKITEPLQENVSDGAAEAFKKVDEQILEAVKETNGMREAVDELIGRLNEPIEWKGLGDLIDQMNGVKRKAMDAKEFIEPFMTDAAQKSIEILEKLNTPIKYGKNLQKDIDQRLGIGRESENAQEAWMKALINVKEETVSINKMTEAVKEVGNAFKTAAEQKQAFMGDEKGSAESVRETVERTVQSIKLSKRELNALKNLSRDKSITKTQFDEKVDEYVQKHENLAGWIDRNLGIGKKWVSPVDPENTPLKGLLDSAETASKASATVQQAVQTTVESAKKETASLKEVSKATEEVAEKKKLLAEPTDLSSGSILARDLIGDPKKPAAHFKALQIEAARTGETIDEVKKRIEEYKAALHDTNTQNLEKLFNSSPVELMASKVDAMKQKLISEKDSGALDEQKLIERVIQIQRAESQLETLKQKEEKAASAALEVADAQEEATKTTRSFADSLEDLKKSIKGIGVVKLVNQFMRMAKMRMIRYVIREISKGFSEGVQNVYQYNKAIGGTFFKSMDSAASALLQMKNSVGAAAAPLIQMLIPYLQQLTNAFIQVVNWANQFFALLNGQQTWTHAVPATAQAFNDQANAAHNAANAVKDLLADWDELNIIQSKTGGGTNANGTSNAEDYLNMFEEIGTFENRIKKLTDWIKDNLDSVKRIAIEIGAALLAWKISSGLTGVLGTISTWLFDGITIALMFDLTKLFSANYLDSGDVGWLIADVLATAVGAKILFGKGGTLGTASATIGLTVSAIADLISLLGATDVSALSQESLLTALKAALKVGAGFFLLDKNVFHQVGSVALAKSAGVAAITMGAIIGIKAFKDVIDTGEVTMDTVKASLLSAISTGLGVTAIELAAGATLTAAMATAAGAMLVTGLVIAAGIGIATILNAGKDDIQWGEEKLTDQQIEDFVNEEMFSINVKASMSVISDKVTVTPLQRVTIAAKLANALSTWKIIKLGVATQQDYETMKSDVDGIITEVNKYIEQAKDTGKLVLEYTPTLAGGDKKEQSQWYKDFTSGWDTIDKWVSSKGEQIGDLLVKAEAKKITDEEALVLDALMNQLTDVTTAISNARVNSAALSSMKLAIGDIDQASFDGIVEAYTKYKEELRKEQEALVSEAYTMQGELVAALFVLRNDSPEAMRLYKEAKSKYDEMGENLVQAVDDAVRESSQSGADWLVSFLQKKYGDAIKKYSDNTGWDMIDFLPDPNMNANVDANDARQVADYLNLYLSDLMRSINGDLGRYVSELDLPVWSLLNKEWRDRLTESLSGMFGPEMANEIIAQWQGKNPMEEVAEKVGNELANKHGSLKLHGGKDSHTFLLGLDADVTPTIDTSKVEDELEPIEEMTENVIIEATKEAQAATENSPLKDPIRVEPVDDTEFKRKLEEIVAYTKEFWAQINQYLSGMAGFSPAYHTAGGFGETSVPVVMRGTPVTSGDLIMQGAKLSMGKGGGTDNGVNVVDGISRGVSGANEDMVSELRTMTTLMQRILATGLTAKVVPSASMGRNNVKSMEAYNRVTGD